MNDELETRLDEAFAARAATTTTSDDAWARVNRRGARHDHRRSVVLRSVAAAAVAVLVVGGGVALFRDRGGSGTVATGSSADASKSMAEDSAAAPDSSGGFAAGHEGFEASWGPSADPTVPAGASLSAYASADRGLTITYRNDGLVGTIEGASIGETRGALVPRSDGTTDVFGTAPVDAEVIRLTDASGRVVYPARFHSAATYFGASGLVAPIMIEALDASGRPVGTAEVR